MKIKNVTNGLVVSENAVLADTFFTRLLGLIPSNGLSGDECLLITHCAMIHTCFMRFSIDAVFIGKDLKVVGVIKNLKPWRFSRYYSGAFYTAEFRAGFASGKFKQGDRLEFISCSGIPFD